MKTFTRLVEQLEIERYYKINCQVTLTLIASNEGEAGYLADSELGGLENQTNFVIGDIFEISKDEYDKLMLVEESVSEHIAQLSKDISAEEKILSTWENEFSGKQPSGTEKMEFYHQMRELGFDGLVIFDTLKGKI